MRSGKGWVLLIVMPAVALLPDITYLLCQKIFYPTPTDVVMLKQQKDPHYVYDGFDHVYIPQLPKNMQQYVKGGIAGVDKNKLAVHRPKANTNDSSNMQL